MKKVLYHIFIALLTINFTSCGLEKKNIVLCVKFETDIENLKLVVNEVNYYRNEKLKKFNLKCSSTEISKVNGSLNNPPSSSVVWSLYIDSKRFNGLDVSLEDFLNYYFKSHIGDQNIKDILNEIREWLKDPRMDTKTRYELENSLQINKKEIRISEVSTVLSLI